jgi:hypothetical protein
LFNLGEWEQAIVALRRTRPAGTEGNAYPLVDYLVGLASSRLGRNDEAVSSLRAYLTWAYAQEMLTRIEVDAHLKLAEVLDRKGRRYDALQERQKGERLRQGIEAYGRSQQAGAAASGGAPGESPPPPSPASPPAPAPAAEAPPQPSSPGLSAPDGR